jgi:hypothetical protein
LWSKLPEDALQIERRSNLSLEEFIGEMVCLCCSYLAEEYDKKNKPVIITDAMEKWRAKTGSTVPSQI